MRDLNNLLKINLKRQFIISFISIFLINIIVSQKGIYFQYLFNLRSFVFNYPVRVFIKKKIYKFYDKEWPNKYIYSAHENNSIYSYQRGFSERVKNLTKAYMLDQITFSKGDIIYDCGANCGDLKLFFDSKKLDINYTAFEPSPKSMSY